MGNSASSKGNPAGHRMSNTRLKSRREQCWTRGQSRKNARRKAQDERERRNRQLRAEGKPTPWEAAQQARQARRGRVSA